MPEFILSECIRHDTGIWDLKFQFHFPASIKKFFLYNSIFFIYSSNNVNSNSLLKLSFHGSITSEKLIWIRELNNAFGFDIYVYIKCV